MADEDLNAQAAAGEQAEQPERFQGFHGEGPHWKRNPSAGERFQPRSSER